MIASLKQNISSLNVSLTDLSHASANLSLRAKSYLARGNRRAALSVLRSKKILEMHFTSQADSLAQLESLQLKIEQAAGNVELISLLQGGAKVLQELNKQTGDVENVEALMENVRQGMASTDEISQMLAEGDEHVDEQKLEEELEAMMEEEVDYVRKTEDAERARREAQRLEEREMERVAESLGSLALTTEHEAGSNEDDENHERWERERERS